MKVHILTVLLFLMIAFGQTPAAAPYLANPRSAAARFYHAYLRLRVVGLPNKEQLRTLSPLLNSDLQRHLESATRRQAKYIREHPGEKPPWADGDLFTSLFEGATSFRIGSPKVKGNRAEVPIHLENHQGGANIGWTDILILTRVNRAWRVWDILYKGDWAYRESLRGNLSEKWDDASNNVMNRTRNKRASHPQSSLLAGYPGVRYRLGSQAVFKSGSNGLPDFNTP